MGPCLAPWPLRSGIHGFAINMAHDMRLPVEGWSSPSVGIVNHHIVLSGVHVILGTGRAYLKAERTLTAAQIQLSNQE
jgi:hypothetical protein